MTQPRIAEVPARRDLAAPALRAFFNITARWGLGNEQERLLLGSPGRSTFYRWKRDVPSQLPHDVLERIGYVGDQEPGDHPIGAYFETHIEQGPVLEDNNKTIGVVSGVLGIRWYDCTVTGMEAHAGPTPMALRKDALQVATHLMQEVVACAHRHPPHGRGTVGMVHVHPNSRNVIPGQVKFSIDLRNATDAECESMDKDIRAVAAKLSADTGLPIKIEEVSNYPAQVFHPDCVDAVGRAAAKLGYSHMPAVSGAGHDAVYMARLAPAGMVFIPCKDGISHNEIEDAKPEHIEAGCNVLLHAMLERAGT